MNNKKSRGHRGRGGFSKYNSGKHKQFRRTDFKRPKSEYRHKEQLSDADVGILKFVSDLEGFTGILKSKYSDFHVNEIDLNGVVAKLTTLEAPSDFNLAEGEVVRDVDYDKTPLELISQEKWDAIKEMMNNESEDKKTVDIEVTELPKEKRVNIHTAVKGAWGSKIVSSTVVSEEKKFIQLRKYVKGDREDKVMKWPKDKGEYVHFLVYKECLDTLEACMKISDCLRMNSSAFNYAGVKDRRAKTTQWFSVRKVLPSLLIQKTRAMRKIHIGNITFKDSPLTLGDLSGNRFRIVVRNVQGDDDKIKLGLESLEKNGFINYFGLQRFGNDRDVPTYSIGIKLLLGQFKEACELILKPKSSDDPDLDISKAKLVYEQTKNAKEAFKEINISKNRCVEAKLLYGLCTENENNFVNALESIPRNMRLLYIHSFQSLIWNMMVSKRIEKFGLKPVEGDFILCNSTDYQGDVEVEEGTEKLNFQQIKALGAEDLDQYSIFDIVLPLPGYDICYPSNLKSEYKETLESYGLSLEMTKQRVKTYNLSGAYRKIMGKISDLEWKIMKYNSDDFYPIISDYEVLIGESPSNNNPEGKYKALVLEFSLHSACYATMVMRELMKMDTSSSTHAKLNNYIEVKPKRIETSEAESNEHFDVIGSCTESLLNNSEKLEEFKRSVFSFDTKRKNEEPEGTTTKKVKTDD